MERTDAVIDVFDSEEMAAAEFLVVNRGDSDLKLNLQSKSCDCIIVSMPDRLRPGTEGKISVKSDLRNSKATLASIAVATNDPARRLIVLTMRYSASPTITVTPEVINIDGAENRTTCFSLILTAQDKAPFIITELSSFMCSVDADVELPTVAKEIHTIPIRLVVQNETMTHDFLSVFVSPPTREPIRIPIRILNNSPYMCVPREIKFGLCLEGEHNNKEIVILSNDNRRFKIVRIDSAVVMAASGAIPLALFDKQTGLATKWKVNLMVRERTVRGVFRTGCILELQDSDSNREEITLMCVGSVRE